MKMWTKKWNITKQISLSEMKVNEEDIVSIRKNTGLMRTCDSRPSEKTCPTGDN